MDVFVNSWVGLFLVLLVVTLSIWFTFIVRANRKTVTHLKQQLEAQQEQARLLEERLSLSSKGILGVGRRLIKTEKRLRQTMDRQCELENYDAENRSLNQISKLLEKGIEFDGVLEKTGVTKSEARLVELFQKKELELQE